jgi:hypothetical protein
MTTFKDDNPFLKTLDLDCDKKKRPGAIRVEQLDDIADY